MGDDEKIVLFCFSLLMLFVERKDLLSFAFVTSIGGC